MSVKVDLDRLHEETTRFGPSPYVLTVSDDGRPHAVAVVVEWDGDQLVLGAGRSTAANATDRPGVTLLWPPYELGGYSLLVDGSATVTPADGEEPARIAVQPEKAILHRSPPGIDRSGHGSDCVRLT